MKPRWITFCRIRWASVLLLLMVAAIFLSQDTAASQEAQVGAETCGGYIWYGQQVLDRIPYAGAECRYRFSARYRDTITIRMYRNGGYLYPALTLLDPYGKRIAVDNNLSRYSSSSISNYWLSRSGTYTIVARSSGNSYGAFRLSLIKR